MDAHNPDAEQLPQWQRDSGGWSGADPWHMAQHGDHRSQDPWRGESTQDSRLPEPSGASGRGGPLSNDIDSQWQAYQPQVEQSGYPRTTQQRTSSTFAQGSNGQELPAQRMIHDVPPPWDGKNADDMAEPYLKLLHGWLSTIRTLKTQQGMTILHYSSGDLKLIINELDVDELTSYEGGQKVYDHIKENFGDYMEKKLPKQLNAPCIPQMENVAKTRV